MNDLKATIAALKPETEAPDPAARARAERRIDQLIATSSAAPEPRGWRLTRLSRAGRHVRMSGFALIGAGVIAAVVALSPFDDGGSNPVLPNPTAARAALERAGTAAGNAPWRPLGPHEYHHTMATSGFATQIPGREEQQYSGADSIESFLRSDGRGIQFMASGTPYGPDRVPEISWPTGEANGVALVWRNPGLPDPSIDAQTRLEYADTVRINDWRPGAERPFDLIWYRQAKGYVLAERRATGGATPAAGLNLGQRYQRDRWGLPYTEVARFNAMPPRELETEFERLIERRGEVAIIGPLEPGDYDETDKWFEEHVRVSNAVRLLGTAPLAPSVRKELFNWLAQRPDAKLEGPARDQRNRPGTRITFERRLDEAVPSFDVTVDQLRIDARVKGQPWDGPISNPRTVKVPAHDSVGRWYQSIIIDEKTGALLQEESFADWKTSVEVPRLMTTTFRRDGSDKGWNLRIGLERGQYGSGGGTVYDVSERTSVIRPLTSACGRMPRMCR